MRITTCCPDFYNVAQGEIAVSHDRLKTTGLASCVGIAITQGDKKLLAHVDAVSDRASISRAISEHFITKQGIRVALLNASEHSDDHPIKGPALKICKDALAKSGIDVNIEYDPVSGGLMSTVNLLHNHIVYVEGSNSFG